MLDGPVTTGKACPKCGTRTLRIRKPWWLRWANLALRHRVTYRRCTACCEWSGIAAHTSGRTHSPRVRAALRSHLPFVTLGRACPRCDGTTVSVGRPRLDLTLGHATRRKCITSYDWSGFAVHAGSAGRSHRLAVRLRPRLPRLAIGRACPRCDARTVRVRKPWWIRWLNPVLGDSVNYRRCPACYRWSGLAIVPTADPTWTPALPPTAGRPAAGLPATGHAAPHHALLALHRPEASPVLAAPNRHQRVQLLPVGESLPGPREAVGSAAYADDARAGQVEDQQTALEPAV